MAVRDLGKGDSGSDVQALQRQLVKIGFRTLVVSGTFDDATLKAVKDTQKKHNLDDDGVVGQNTRAVFKALAAPPVSAVTPDQFKANIVQIANGQFDEFRLSDRQKPDLKAQIEKYYTETGLTPLDSHAQPWSAAFVSYCVIKAGATKAEFRFSALHAVYVRQCIWNKDTLTGHFWGVPFDDTPLQVGDILQNSRGTDRDFAYARTHSGYNSHSAVVVKIVKNAGEHFAVTVGGNESNSVEHNDREILLDSRGRVKQRTASPFIAILRKVK